MQTPMVRSIAAAAGIGTGLGVFAAATVLWGYVLTMLGGRLMHQGPAATAFAVLVNTVVLAGPGAFLLGLPLAAWIRRRPARPRMAALGFGMLAGLAPGLLNYGMATLLFMLLTPERLPHSVGVLAALAGGAGLGLGCAWQLTRPTS